MSPQLDWVNRCADTSPLQQPRAESKETPWHREWQLEALAHTVSDNLKHSESRVAASQRGTRYGTHTWRVLGCGRLCKRWVVVKRETVRAVPARIMIT